MTMALRSFFAFLVTGTLLLGAPADAASCRSLLSVDATSFALPERGVLTPADRASIKRILSPESGLTPQTAWNQVFALYVERRLSTVPAADRAVLRAKINSFSLKYNTVEHFLATSEGMNLPQKFAATPIPTIIRVHETEHLIQMHEKNPHDSALRKTLFYTRGRLDPFRLRKLERDAMLAEWELISVMPEQAMREARMTVHESGVDFEYKTFLVKMLSNYRMSRQEHLADQYSVNRYTLKAIAKNAALEWLGIGINISVFCGSSYLISWLW